MFRKIFLTLYLTPSTYGHNFNVCDNNNSINLKNLELTPDPPIAGENLKVTLTGKTTTPLTSPS